MAGSEDTPEAVASRTGDLDDELPGSLGGDEAAAEEPPDAALAQEADEPEAAEAADEPDAAQAADAREEPAGPPPPPERLEGAIEALLLVSGDVMRLGRIRDVLGMASVVPIRDALDGIRRRWQAAGLALELEEVAGGVRAVTRPEYAEYVGRLGRRPAADKLSRTLIETLCIVAYKQPVGRAEVERIRGVQSGDPLRGLLERRLVKVVGRSDLPGRPLLYGTTQAFLTAFGLNDLKDLPSAKDLSRL